MWNWFLMIFSFLTIYNCIYFTVLTAKESKQTEKNQTNTFNSKITLADFLVFIISGLTIICIIILPIWTNFLSPIVYAVIVTIPCIIMHLYTSFLASNTIRLIVFGKDSKNELSVKEMMDFELAFGIVLIFLQYISWDKITSYFSNVQISSFIIAILVSLILLLFIFLLSFITIVQLIFPLKHLRKLLEFIGKFLGPRCRSLTVWLCSSWHGPIINARLTNTITQKYHISSKKNKLLYVPLIPVFFIIDCIYTFSLMISAYICFTIGICINILRQIFNGILHLLRIITSIPGHKAVKDLFRISGLLSILFVVFSNRLSLFYTLTDPLIAIFEFIASAIVIPIILEWIYSSLYDKSNSSPLSNTISNNLNTNNTDISATSTKQPIEEKSQNSLIASEKSIFEGRNRKHKKNISKKRTKNTKKR